MAVCVVTSLASHSSARTATRIIDLRVAPVFGVPGGYIVGSAGDVNGDRAADILLTSCSGNDGAGVTYVLFGPFRPGQFDVSDGARLENERRGFRINGNRPNTPDHVGDHACHADGAGDVNEDGLDDVVIGAPGVDGAAHDAAGRAYVVFGKTSTEPVDLAAFDNGVQGDAGFRLDGGGTRHRAGRAVAGLGDVNRDGLSDVAITAPFADSVYVVFGKRDPLPVNFTLFELGLPGRHGFRIDTPRVDIDSYLKVGGGGDINGDGASDVVVGYSDAESRGPGAAYVVFGKSDPLSVNVRNLNAAGFEISGPARYSSTGSAVAIIGDANRDGLDDVAVGASSYSIYRTVDGTSQAVSRGAVFVVFGKKSTNPVPLNRLGKRGYAITAANKTYYDGTGNAVAGAGDIDGDGRDDILIGAHGASYGDRKGSGSVFVVFGKGGTRTIKLRSLGSDGYRIVGPRRNSFIGGSVAGPGNIIGNKRPDVLSGAGTIVSPAYLVPGRR